MTLRIAMVGACPFPVPQGSQAHLADTARVVQSLGHEVTLAVYGYGIGVDPPDLTVKRAWAPFRRGKTRAGPSLGKPLHDLALTVHLRSLRDVDLIHAHNYEGLLCALASGRRPIVYQAHNAMADELPYYFGGCFRGCFRGAAWAGRFGAWLDRALPRRADAVIVPHERLGAYLQECGCEASKVSVIPPALDAALFEPAQPGESMPPVLYTGNLDAYQNLPLLVEAMKRVRTEEPRARLVIATADACALEGAEVIPVHDLAGLRALLAEEAVVACPRVSWSGYPIKLLNAMAAAQAIVACASAAPGLTHETDALIVPGDDPDAFADALLRLLRDAELRRRLGHAARVGVETRHAPAVIGESLERVYAAVSTPPLGYPC